MMLQRCLDSAVQLLWGRGTILLTLLCGLYFTVFTGFLPITHLPTVIRCTIGSLFSSTKEDGVSPFAAVSTALGGTMGVGNIIGVGAALALGGAGSIFWMWVGAFLGMMTKYMEVFLAVQWREQDRFSRSMRGGPMYYISRGIPNRFGKALAGIFCIFCALASFTSGSMTQTNAIAQSLWDGFSLSPVLTAVCLTLLCSWVLGGGCDRAVSTCAALVPLMSLFYLGGCTMVLLRFRNRIPAAFAAIFAGAFAPESVGTSACCGCAAGFFTALRVGISRGIFTHEAGLGSASIAHACSGVKDPVVQGFWGIFEVFCDTILVCTVTALVILSSSVPLSPSGAHQAFVLVMGKAGGGFLAAAISLFAFASVISFCLYGQRCIEYLFPGNNRAISIYRLLFLTGCAAGCFTQMPLVLSLADLLNACLLIPNLIALVLLSPGVFAGTRAWFCRQKRHK